MMTTEHMEGRLSVGKRWGAAVGGRYARPALKELHHRIGIQRVKAGGMPNIIVSSGSSRGGLRAAGGVG